MPRTDKGPEVVFASRSPSGPSARDIGCQLSRSPVQDLPRRETLWGRSPVSALCAQDDNRPGRRGGVGADGPAWRGGEVRMAPAALHPHRHGVEVPVAPLSPVKLRARVPAALTSYPGSWATSTSKFGAAPEKPKGRPPGGARKLGTSLSTTAGDPVSSSRPRERLGRPNPS